MIKKSFYACARLRQALGDLCSGGRVEHFVKLSTSFVETLGKHIFQMSSKQS